MDVTALIVLVIFVGAIVILCCAAYTYVKFCIKNNRRTNSIKMKVTSNFDEKDLFDFMIFFCIPVKFGFDL